MSLFKYYYDLMSQPARAMYIILKVSGTPFESCPVALRKGEHFTKDYETNVNRFKKVPCIVDKDGFKLSESVAILRYLDKDISKQLYPDDKQLRGRVDEYLEWQHNNTRMGCSMYFVKKYLQPVVLGIEVDPKEVKMCKQLMEQTLDLIENVWLNNQKFLCGNTLTAADIFAACEIEQVAVTKYNATENRPKLKAWLKNVKESTNPHYDEAHKFVHKLAARQSKL